MGMKPRNKKTKPRIGAGGYEQPETVLDALGTLHRELGTAAWVSDHVVPTRTLSELKRIMAMFELRHTNDTGLDTELRKISECIRKGDNVNAIGRCNSLIGSLLNRLATRGK